MITLQWQSTFLLNGSVSIAGIFGQSLEETMEYERRVGTRKVPEVVEMCVEFLMQNALDVEGLFR